MTMAYNYFPMSYQTYYQQPVLQPVQQQTGIIWVSGDAEAEAYPVAPNNAVRLWHSTLPVVYFKQADASGKPTLKAFDLVERSQSVSEGTSASSGKGSDYATKKELAALSAAVEALKGDVAKLREVDHE